MHEAEAGYALTDEELAKRADIHLRTITRWKAATKRGDMPFVDGVMDILRRVGFLRLPGEDGVGAARRDAHLRVAAERIADNAAAIRRALEDADGPAARGGGQAP